MNNDINVFISYNISSSEKIVEKIVKLLEEKGVKCFYAFRNCNTQESGFEKDIPEAIDQCKVFIFMLNKNSNESEHCFNEIKLAFDRIAKHERMSIIVYRLDDCMASKSVKYYLCRSHEMQGTIPPEEERMEELINRVLYRLEKVPMYGELEDENHFGLQIVGKFISPDSSFVGRKKELEEIRNKLSSNINKLFLVGMGGIGKSEIVKKYCVEYKNNYEITVWIPFEKSLIDTFCNDSKLEIQGMKRESYKEDSDKKYALRKLDFLKAVSNKNVLVVIDNFDVSDDELLEEFLKGEYSVIFTTRNRPKRDDLVKVDIKPMSDEELLDLFRVDYKREINENNINDINNIIKYLDGHTLAIRQVSKIMQEQRINPSDMLKVLSKDDDIVLSGSRKRAVDSSYEIIKKTFAISMLGEEEIKILKNLSLFSLNGVTVEELYEWCDFDDFDVINDLVARNWVIYDASSDIAYLHPLISDLMHEKIEENDSDIINLLNSVAKICANQVRFNYKEKLFHASVAEYIVGCLKETDEMYNEMRFAKGKAYSDISLFAKAKEEFEYCYKNAKTLRDRMRACHFYSQNRLIEGYPEECYKIAMEGYQEFKDLDPLTWPDDSGAYMQNVLQRIGEGAKYMGNLEEALKYFKMAEEPCHRYALGSIYHSLGWVYYQLADVLFEMHRLDESCEYVEKSKEAFKEGNEEWSYTFILSVGAKIYMENKEYEKALELNMESINKRIEFDGEDSVGSLYESRGDIYLAMGNKEEAFKCFDKAMEIYTIKKISSKNMQAFKDKLASIK